jgi:hypothetical protein
VRIGNNEAANSVTRRWQVSRPSLVFSPIPLLAYQPRGGTVYAGRALSKLEIPEIPVLGVDVVREAESKRLFIMEVNPKGDTWHLSLLSKSLTEQQRRDRYEQFGALDVVARSLMEKTRADAT